jgi:hypothetical protein
MWPFNWDLLLLSDKADIFYKSILPNTLVFFHKRHEANLHNSLGGRENISSLLSVPQCYAVVPGFYGIGNIGRDQQELPGSAAKFNLNQPSCIFSGLGRWRDFPLALNQN